MFYFRYERKIRGLERETWATLETWCSNEQDKSQYVTASMFVFTWLTQFLFQSSRPWPYINQFSVLHAVWGLVYQFQKMMAPWRTVKYIKEWPWFSTLFFILEPFFNIQNKTKIPVLKCTGKSLLKYYLCVFFKNHYFPKWLRLSMWRIKWHVFLIFIFSFQENR